MINIYLRINGEKKELPLPENQKGTFLNIISKELNFPFDIEINLCNPGTLGTEIFLDPRLKEKITNEKKERLNKIVAGKTYSDLNLCYVCCFNETVLFLRTILHELNHFQDPYECSEEDYITPMEEGEYIEPKGYVKNLISAHLNDFFAEYYSINKIIDLYDRRVKGFNLILAIDYNFAYLEDNEKCTKEQISSAFKNEISDFEKKLTVIYFIHHNIIKLVFFFLSFYRAIQDNGFSTRLYENRWNKFISEEISSPLGNLLNKIKEKILDRNLDLLEYKVGLRESINELVFDFYENDIDDYLSEVFKERIRQSPFSFIQDLAHSINVASSFNFEWMNQLRQIYSNFNFGWIKQLQQIQKSLIEPFSHIASIAHSFNNILPNLRIDIDKEDEDQDDLDVE